MLNRILPLSLVAALALTLAVGVAAAARTSAPADKDADNTHSGIVVSVADGSLTMTDKDGKNQHKHTVAKDATITCDGKDCKLEDLKKGLSIVVTTKEGDQTVAVKIEAKSADKNDK
jgi:hypothetical protein